MLVIRIVVLAALMASSLAFAQSDTTATPNAETPPPPPLVDAPPKESDAPKKDDEAPTPPPPGAHLPNGNQTGYQYSPYGAPLNQPKEPPKEYGLMATEFLFGALTAAPIVLLPYILFLRPAIQARNVGALGPDDAGLVNILFLVIFASVPVAVAQTEIGLANGSRYYYAESWPAYLSGLLAQGAVLGLYYLVGSSSSIAEPLLLGGTLLFVPAIETAAINFTKQPKEGLGGFGMLNHSPGRGWALGRPSAVPLISRIAGAVSVGVNVPVMAGTF